MDTYPVHSATMHELVPDVLGELLSLVAAAVGTVAFTGLGLLGEQAGWAAIMAGDLTLGGWEVFIGTWALVVGIYLLGVKQTMPRVRALLADRPTPSDSS